MPMDVAVIGTGEYVTGFVQTSIKSDKKIGVVGIVLFDLRRRRKVGRIILAGTNGGKFKGIRQHFKQNITEVYNGLNCDFEAYPEDDSVDTEAYKKAIDSLAPKSAVIIFTPDSTHFPIAKYAIQKQMHVLLTKPAVQKLQDHYELLEEARKVNVFVMVEHHKRFDPAYMAAKLKAKDLGDFSYFYSMMTQPKTQLETFKSWAGKDSDISYYLNSHHIDVLVWLLNGQAYPTKVTASASAGVATEEYGCVKGTEDTITLLVEWQSSNSPTHRGTAIFTASWTAPTHSGVHSDQGFHYAASKGDIRIDQAHRGFQTIVSGEGPAWINPFYVQYVADEEGNFAGQHGYGYLSIEKFIDGVQSISEGSTTPEVYDDRSLPTLKNTVLTAAILHAGRLSLDEKRSVTLNQIDGRWRLE